MSSLLASFPLLRVVRYSVVPLASARTYLLSSSLLPEITTRLPCPVLPVRIVSSDHEALFTDRRCGGILSRGQIRFLPYRNVVLGPFRLYRRR